MVTQLEPAWGIPAPKGSTVRTVGRACVVTSGMDNQMMRQRTHENVATVLVDPAVLSTFELDLMARLAGLRLAHRWENWQRAPFGDASTVHVSVWEKVPGGTW